MNIKWGFMLLWGMVLSISVVSAHALDRNSAAINPLCKMALNRVPGLDEAADRVRAAVARDLQLIRMEYIQPEVVVATLQQNYQLAMQSMESVNSLGRFVIDHCGLMTPLEACKAALDTNDLDRCEQILSHYAAILQVN